MFFKNPTYMPFWLVSDAIMSFFLLSFTVLSCKHKMVIIALPLPERLPMRSLLYSCHPSTKKPSTSLFSFCRQTHQQSLDFFTLFFVSNTHVCNNRIAVSLSNHQHWTEHLRTQKTEEKCINAKSNARLFSSKQYENLENDFQMLIFMTF